MKYLLIICTSLLFFVAPAQEGNKVFHEVQAGETKYGISRAYGISIEALEKFNPDLRAGLRVGMKLYIPAPSQEDKAKNESTDVRDTVRYIYHTVQEGQTLYSLSKDYGLDYAEIKALNPEVEDGLKLGQVLRFPKNAKRYPDVLKPEEGYVLHTVQQGETAYSLARIYGLSLDSLYLLNPQLRDVLAIGQQLRFPEKGKVQNMTAGLNSDADTSSGPESGSEEYFLYKVKSGDTFYSLRKKFSVKRKELIRLNPELESSGLRNGLYIILPNKGKNEEAAWLDQLFSEVESDNSSSLEIPARKEVKKEEAVPNLDTIQTDYTKRYRVALMLPFFAPASLDTSFRYSNEVEKRSLVAMEFYQGFLMAADSLSHAGMNLSLDVQDTRNSKITVETKINALKRVPPDLIVGPLYANHVERVADEFAGQGTPVVSPLSNAVDVSNRANLIKCITSATYYTHAVAEILNGSQGRPNIVFAHTATPKELEELKQIKARLKATNGPVVFEELVGTDDNRFTVGSQVKDALREGSKNIFVVLSEKEVFLADMVNKLYALRDTSIQVVAPSKLLNINALDYKYLNAINLIMPDGNFIDQHLAATAHFENKYRARYKMMPSRFAYQGYDVGIYFLSHLWQYGPYFLQSLDKDQELLGTGFRLAKQKQGGYENTFMFTTALKDLELVRLN